MARCCRVFAAVRPSTGRCCVARRRPAPRCTTWCRAPTPVTSSISTPCRFVENDTAYDVFLRVADAAEVILTRSLPLLIAGTAPRIPQDLSTGRILRPTASRGRAHRLVAVRARDPQPGARRRAALSRARSPSSAANAGWSRARECCRAADSTGSASDAARRGRASASSPASMASGSRCSRRSDARGPDRSSRACARGSSTRPSPSVDLSVRGITLKVDVDTLRGTREGVPRLAALLRRTEDSGDVSLQPRPRPHRPCAAPHIPARIPQQGPPHLGGLALRHSHAAVRHAAAGSRHRAAVPRRDARRWPSKGFEVGVHALRPCEMAGRSRARIARVDAASR